METRDAIVIGAGFGGLYSLHKLRGLGLSVVALEMGDGVGGTWYWNRYPGARVDVQSLEYCYAFSREIEEEWEWTELMAPQPEIESYLNFVAERLDLRRDIRLSTRVTAMHFDQERERWLVETEPGDRYDAQFVIAATGCLSAPLEPNIPGVADFVGDVLNTNRYPREGFDFSGKRVGVVGTGSSGVQVIPEIAEDAAHLTVFQRSAAYTRPAGNRPLQPDELRAWYERHPNVRADQRNTYAGVLHPNSAVSPPLDVPRRILETPREERMAVLDEMGWAAPLAWADVMMDLEANRAGRELYAELVRRHVRDPAVAEDLIPHYPMGCKRQILDTSYFETFNRDNVVLVNLRKDALRRILENGIETASGIHELDVIVFATGFDAMTGALSRIDIRGRDGISLRDFWATEGPYTYLGLQVAGFPNLFTITGPLSPSVFTNMVVSIEQHVDWIGDALAHMAEHGYRTIETTQEAQERWAAEAQDIAEQRVPVRVDEACASWYLGANVPGKKRILMPFGGGVPLYSEKLEEVVARGYEGFVFDSKAARNGHGS